MTQGEYARHGEDFAFKKRGVKVLIAAEKKLLNQLIIVTN